MCNSRKLVWWNTDKSFRWQNVTNLLFRHRVFASVNPSCVCNMFVVCVKRTIGILLSFSWTFLCILYVRLWSCFSRTISSLYWDVVFLVFIIHMQYLFVVFIFMSAIILIAYHLDLLILSSIFIFIWNFNSTKVFIQQFIVLIKLTLLQTKVRRLKFVVPD